ncbi:ATP-dependent sacrificial sulfur transferase LarE [Candidatus Aminicenantes bacterium AC-335-B20]|jgi:uncharacterized protein|nr:ATP-dependent sacrificial sulfur transferase LarE [SCandidatus Aminicenantes bacterium Aminicenantia_JdfR_composite]MCP2597556.1 ATP-dependent sacrificial sulfur transferase LarE [Candidatus Aminicenantes bacterium AC-335-G13]MCP2599188.1 ATP-dependent sacrificial sulfur transferase LarE [Candidatus Aminicenantes bacterium AC-335-B20]MCP2605515.1 ATP-dependent sacrificial sulfur transferase LarE [Candidatus Aminicenantes bacterium AC-335-O07]MCP2619153.1 ATP-dependent sacrificial sulfur tran
MINSKLSELKKILSEMGSVLIAYSGGVDSTFLLKVAKEVLGKNVLAVTAQSETYPQDEIEEAKKLAKEIGVRHIIIETEELKNPEFSKNPPERCYYCKKELFSKLKEIAEKEGIKFIVDGSNYDDLKDFRPGMKAGIEYGIRSPLKEAGLTKKEIRHLSRELGLKTWDKPQLACLASRFPPYTEINPIDLKRVGEAEKFLKNLGLKQIRVRHHYPIARLEFSLEDFPIILDSGKRELIVNKLKELGYLYVTLDLEGYKTGSLNRLIPDKEK